MHNIKNNIANTIMLITKQYIYRKKCLKEKPNLKGLKLEIMYTKQIELYNACIDGRQVKVSKKWEPVQLNNENY